MIDIQMRTSRKLLFSTCLFTSATLFISCDDSATVHATRKNIIESVYASGKIIAENEHSIFSLTNGSVETKLVQEGDTLRKGQALFEINNITSTSGLKVSKDKIDLLQQFTSPGNLAERSYIRSDCDGIVYQVMKEQGEAVRMNEPVAFVGDASKRIIRLGVDQQDIEKIKPGQQVLFKTDITGDSVYPAVVKKIYQMMNESNQSFRVDAVFAEPFPSGFIHCPVEANIVVSKKENALVLPRTALEGKDSLLIEENGKRKKIHVNLGAANGDYVEILNGIDENTNIIVTQQK
ncbi:MAG TPA: HlyD family efflux transporter periplasmic adaptor subunit [Parafilimonas sp.]|nr:HlyD family efflux transporter periplasmic adaptor subunit [Parafilimonas sp.]